MASGSSSTDKKSKKVLIAMDGSKHAEYALRYYKENGYEESDEVFVVYAVEYGHLHLPMFPVDPQVVARIATEGEREVEKMVEKLAHLMTEIGVKGKVVRCSASTNPGEGVTHFAKEHDVTMIVTGTRGHGKLRRTLMGSVSQYIVHHAHVPVLVCRHDK